MCFSCIHPYHSRNLHTNIRLFHTGFIGWTESIDESHMHINTHIRNNGHKDSMDMHTGNGWLSLFLQCPPCSHSGIGRPRKNRKKDRDDSGFSGTLLVSLSLRRIPYEPNTEMLVYGYLWMRLCFCGRTRTLPTLVPIIQRFRGFRKTKYKRIRTGKGWGVPGPYPTSQIYADVGVFSTSTVPW